MTVPLFGLGAAVLAFWAVARFPRVGPQSVGAAFVVVVAVFVLQTPVLGLVDPVLNQYGGAAGLLFVIFPSPAVVFSGPGGPLRRLVEVWGARPRPGGL